MSRTDAPKQMALPGCKLFGMGPRTRLLIALLLAGTARAVPIGNFTDASDVGAVSRTVEVSYDAATGTYTVGASGDNIWGERDEFGFVWKATTGDIAISARIELQGDDGHAHRKAGLMLRESMAPDSAYVDVVVHGDGLTSLQFRSVAGGVTREVQCAKQAASALRLEKRGDYVSLLLADINGRFEPSGCTIKVPLRGGYYAGLVVCAHDNAGIATAKFRHVSLGLLPKRNEIRTSAIELITIDSLSRKVVYRSTSHLDSPSFTAAGNAICFREDGRLQYFSLTANTEPRLVGAENVDECQLASPVTTSPSLVSHDIKGGRAQVFSRGPGGAKPVQLTKDRLSNWMPRLSPDGSSIAFISGTEPPDDGKPAAGDYLLRRMASEGGEPREFAHFFGGPGTLGPAPWSRDGKQLVFVSREAD
jgi:TolB protein